MTAAFLLALGLAVAAFVWSRRRERENGTLRASLQEAVAQSVDVQALARRLEAVLSAASEGLLLLDANGCVVTVNEAALRLAPLPPQGWRGSRIEDLVPWPTLHAAVRRCRDSSEDIAFEVDDEVGGRMLAIRVRAIPRTGCVVGIDDQSRLKRLESLRRDFVANVSHELKTPLTAIQGLVETLTDDREMHPETRQRFLGRIARQTERLTKLVADLLRLSRLDEPDVVAQPLPPRDLVGAMRDIVRDLAPLAERRGLVLSARLPEQTVGISADAEALQQIGSNLIDNAIKYTPAGGSVQVQVTTGNGRALLEVVDTGIGLAPEDQERVFERFYRVDRARSSDMGGTGLGLSIVKNTVRNLGGEVGVNSGLGKGSTFWVSLPLATPESSRQ